MDENGPGEITHFWCTIASRDPNHLKALVLRMYWDNETSPSVEAPIGDFFGQGLGEYHQFESAPLKVGSIKALNSFFPMPFSRHARVTVTNESSIPTAAFYFNIDWHSMPALPPNTFYFHAQYRQAAPNHGWTNQWTSNGDPRVEDRKNLNGDGNYVFLDAQGRGHFVGITLSVLQNQDGWWGEGDDMIFVDGENTPSINGTGSEDYFLGALTEIRGYRDESADGISAVSHFLIHPLARLWWEKRRPAAAPASIAFIPIHPFHSPNQSVSLSSTATPTIAPITTIRSLIGTNQSPTRHSRPCHHSTSGCSSSFR